MLRHTIKIEEKAYRYLEQDARFLGISIEEALSKIIEKQIFTENQTSDKCGNSESVYVQKSRWAQISRRIRKNPPLRGVGDYVRECSKEFRGDFSLGHDVE